MGIPSFYSWLYRKYNQEHDLVIDEDEAILKLMSIKHLFFDYNSLIHPCAHKVLSTINNNSNNDNNDNYDNLEDEIIKNTILYTRYIIHKTKVKNIYIMIDGVAPRGKINQQRERRYKSWFEQRASSIQKEELKSKIMWNSNKITPGTKFMNSLTEKLQEFIIEMEKINITIFLSDSSQVGEGEHKIMKYIQDIEKTEQIMIYGLDADLIMLSLLSKSDNIYLLRDNSLNDNLPEHKRTYTFLDISKLKKLIYQDFQYRIKFKCNEQNIINDYIFICFLLGNDFLEHIPSLQINMHANNIEFLINCYIQNLNTINFNKNNNIIYLTSDKSCDINIVFLKQLFLQLAQSENFYFQKIYNTKILHIKENNEQNLMYIYNDDFINFKQDNYKSRYYFINEISDSHLNDACLNYIEGLFWVWQYYNNHYHSNWTWYYKYHSTPFISDLSNYFIKNSIFIENYLKQSDNLKQSCPNSELEQLFMVLPKESLIEIINELDIELTQRVKRIFKTNSQLLEKYYPSKIYLDIICKDQNWKAKIFLDELKKDFLLNIFFN